MDMTARELFKIPYYYVQAAVRALGRGWQISVSLRTCLLFSVTRSSRVRTAPTYPVRIHPSFVFLLDAVRFCFIFLDVASRVSRPHNCCVRLYAASQCSVIGGGVRIASSWLFLRMLLGCDGPDGICSFVS